MNRIMKSVLLAGAAWSAASTMAMAQNAAPGEEQATALDEMVVTARRRDELIQDVPGAVTAI